MDIKRVSQLSENSKSDMPMNDSEKQKQSSISNDLDSSNLARVNQNSISNGLDSSRNFKSKPTVSLINLCLTFLFCLRNLCIIFR